VTAGTVRIVGVEEQGIRREAGRLLTDDAEYRRMSVAHNPYGDGEASRRIAEYLVGEGREIGVPAKCACNGRATQGPRTDTTRLCPWLVTHVGRREADR